MPTTYGTSTKVRGCPHGCVIDWVLVERASNEHTRHRLNHCERREIVKALHRRGFNDCRIHDRTGISQRTAMRVRQECGLSAIPQDDFAVAS